MEAARACNPLILFWLHIEGEKKIIRQDGFRIAGGWSDKQISGRFRGELRPLAAEDRDMGRYVYGVSIPSRMSDTRYYISWFHSIDLSPRLVKPSLKCNTSLICRTLALYCRNAQYIGSGSRSIREVDHGAWIIDLEMLEFWFSTSPCQYNR